MDATMFDGTTTTPLTPELAAQDSQRGFTWYDMDVAGAGADSAARDVLAALTVPPAVQGLLLKPNRSAQILVQGDAITGVTWVGEDVDGAAPPEVHLLWTAGRLVTVRWGGGDAVGRIREQLATRSRGLFANPGSALGVVLMLMNASVDRRLTHLDFRLNEIDDAFVQGSGTPPLDGLRALRSEVSALQLRYGGLVDAAGSAVVDPNAVPGVDAASVAQLQEYVTHVTDTYHHIRELADGARGALQDYQTSVGNKQGDRINQLTIVSVVFLPISFLTGYFGMNFTWLDNQLLSAASWLIWGVALPIVVLAVSILTLQRYGYLTRKVKKYESAGAAARAARVQRSSSTTAPSRPSPPAGS